MDIVCSFYHIEQARKSSSLAYKEKITEEQYGRIHFAMRTAPLDLVEIKFDLQNKITVECRYEINVVIKKSGESRAKALGDNLREIRGYGLVHEETRCGMLEKKQYSHARDSRPQHEHVRLKMNT